MPDRLLPDHASPGTAQRNRQLLRLFLALGVAFVIAFGQVVLQTKPTAEDPFVDHLIAAGVFAALWAVSYASWMTTARLYRLIQAALVLLLGWYTSLALRNLGDPDYHIGMVFMVAATAGIYGLTIQRLRSLHGFLALNVALTGVIAWLDPPGGHHPAFFVASILGTLVVLYLVIRARFAATLLRQRSEALLKEAEEMAQVGSWERHLETGEELWSDEMYRLLGLRVGPARLTMDGFRRALVLPDRLHFASLLDAAAATGAAQATNVRIEWPDGTLRTLRVRLRHLPGPDGLRLFGVCMDITDQQAREAALRTAKEEAEEAARLKDAILTNTSHELRTPLTSIIGFAQLLQLEVGDEQREMVEPIIESGERLLATLNAVLDLAQLRSGALDLEQTRIDLREEVRESVRLLHVQAQARGLSLFPPTLGPPVYVCADRAAIQRIVNNLVGNALKFTAVGHITVSVEADGDGAYLGVSDTGSGIEKSFLPDLFKPFHQASTGFARSHEGSGLGLTITKQLVDMLGGEITLESTVGVGTTFTVRLPLATAEALATSQATWPPHEAPAPAVQP